MTEWNMQIEAGGEHFQKICDFTRELSLENSPVQFIPDVYDCWCIYRKGIYSITRSCVYLKLVLLCKCFF